MLSQANSCSTCGLWRRRQKPGRREATEYQSWRPCSSNIQPGLHGRAAINYAGTQLLTAPDTRCDFWVDSQSVQRPPGKE